MTLTKKQEADLLKIYKSYWDCYLAGDVKGMASLLDASYTQVGSAEGEVFNTKPRAIKFLNKTIDQIAGKGKINNQKINVEALTVGVLDKVEIRVSDNGNGVPKHIVDKMFQLFFTTKPTGQGTGLGLSLSYDIITKGHGGELKVDTREGSGSVFTICLASKD